MSFRQAQSIYENMMPEDDLNIHLRIANIASRETIDFLENKVDGETWTKIKKVLREKALDEINQEQEDADFERRYGDDDEYIY